jgi:hypothetical protein
MILVICPPTDRSGLWVYRELARRGLRVDLATTEMLEDAPRWQHTISSDSAEFRVTLRDGRLIRSDQLTGVFNRISWAPSAQLLEAVVSGDRAYASQEWWAFFLSWLQCVHAPVLNRPTPQGLCGRFRHQVEWALLAQRAGLRVPGYLTHLQSSSERAERQPSTPNLVVTVIVLQGDIFGPPELPKAIQEGCRRLACLAETELLGISFGRAPKRGWSFAGASPCPDLTSGGALLIDGLISCFTDASLRRGAKL